MSELSPANTDNPIPNGNFENQTIQSDTEIKSSSINRTVRAEREISDRQTKIKRNETIAQQNIDTANASIEKVSEQVGKAAGKDLRAALQQKLIDAIKNEIAQNKAFQARKFIEEDLNRIANALYESSLQENDRLAMIEIDAIEPAKPSDFKLKLSRPPRTSSMNELLEERVYLKPISKPSKLSILDN